MTHMSDGHSVPGVLLTSKVEQFWRFYSHMVRPGDLTGHSDFHLFKEGIKPMWEDDANKNGGKWIIRLRKGLASRCWENLILAMLGEQFMVGEEICGAVVSVRFQEDIISIWNKTASDQATTARIRDTLRRVLNLPPNTIMEYKTHTDSIKCLASHPRSFFSSDRTLGSIVVG
uniref:Eukaryotic translation initiation factor 4E family member 2 n=1 Tax=Naja naja TaxID=35670 RepID=A0A8C6VFB5_NAJNA